MTIALAVRCRGPPSRYSARGFPRSSSRNSRARCGPETAASACSSSASAVEGAEPAGAAAGAAGLRSCSAPIVTVGGRAAGAVLGALRLVAAAVAGTVLVLAAVGILGGVRLARSGARGAQTALLVLARRVLVAVAREQLLELGVEFLGQGDVRELLDLVARGLGLRGLRAAGQHLRGGQQVGVVPLALAPLLALGVQHALPPGERLAHPAGTQLDADRLRQHLLGRPSRGAATPQHLAHCLEI